MYTKCLVTVSLLIVAFGTQHTYAESQQHRNFIFELAKKIIEKIVDTISSIVDDQIRKIDDIRQMMMNIAKKIVEKAIEAINIQINSTLNFIRKVMEEALDKGIDISECYVSNVDRLNIARRQFISNEVKCATDEVGTFNDILQDAIGNFTEDLAEVIELPSRLKKCLPHITVVQCITGVIRDATKLQTEIPKQLIATMNSIMQYMDTFDSKVHKCQFAVLRNTVNVCGQIIQKVTNCTLDPKLNYPDSSQSMEDHNEKSYSEMLLI